MATRRASRFLKFGIAVLLPATVAVNCGRATLHGNPDGGVGGSTITNTGGATSADGGVANSAGGNSNPAGGVPTNMGGATSAAGGRSAGTGGTADNTGGSAGTGGTDPCAAKTACTSPTTCTPVAPSNAMIANWVDVCLTTGPNGCYGMFVDNDTYSAPDANWWTKFFGGTYVYPGIDPKGCGAVPAYPLTQTISPHSWHITGTVGDYSGFGLWLAPCTIDLSAYTGGISVTISGSVGKVNTIQFNVGTSSNSPHDPTNCNSNVGTCTAAKCASASTTISLTSTPTTVTIPWSGFTGGLPNANPNAAEVTSISFSLPDPYLYTTAPPVATPYAVDITIGDIVLVP